ncbi:outer membrane protein assembly factor BamB [Moraxella sp. VT-16-12]|uniref:outer membrane protein assembly factor BamB n=1 Tax=Moraxella sp. VT-16-12 TaxID=2014877 RepID=UPI000B7F9AEB|nr:outer membrane protein assembly factor BamB [Moraxella sp. VT-16-12]TWV84056.1 outer membrane protein assembly factor BamB [Moraxella sp. VT-16-12]
MKNHNLVKTALVSSLVVVSLVGAGCSKSIKPQERKPAKLIKVDNAVSVLNPMAKIALPQGGGRLLNKTAINKKDVIDLQVAIIDRTLIAVSRSGLVAAYALHGGQMLWSVDIGEAVVSGVGVEKDSGTVVVGTRSGKVVAIDANSQAIRWQKTLPSSSLAPALVAHDRVMVSANDGVIYALSTQTGQQVWQFNAQTPEVSLRGVATPLYLDGQTAVFGTADGRIYAINPEIGRPLWNRRVGRAVGGSQVHRMSDVDGQPLVVGHHLYAISVSGQLTGYDTTTGQTMFTASLASNKSLTALGNLLIGASLDGDVVAFDRITGQKMWENSELKYRKLTNPIAIGNYVAVGDLDGVIHVLDNSGKIISRTETKGRLTSLHAQNRHLYTQTTDGVVNVWQF